MSNNYLHHENYMQDATSSQNLRRPSKLRVPQTVSLISFKGEYTPMLPLWSVRSPAHPRSPYHSPQFHPTSWTPKTLNLIQKIDSTQFHTTVTFPKHRKTGSLTSHFGSISHKFETIHSSHSLDSMEYTQAKTRPIF